MIAGPAVAIIPARGGSKRFPRKNLHPVLGRPMIFWAIDACRRSGRFEGVFVSTEDDEIARVAVASGAEVIARPAELAGDEVFKQRVIEHAVTELLGAGRRPDLVASVQANSPELDASDLERAFRYMERFGLWEVLSVDADLCQNGAFRLMRKDVVFQRTLSVHCGVVVTDLIDVHTEDDVRRVEARLVRRRTSS